MAQKMYATFNEKNDAERAVADLLERGMEKQDITIVMNNREHEYKEVDASDTRQMAVSGVKHATEHSVTAETAQGAGMGVGVGMMAGVAALLLPGVGMIWGSGALAAYVATLAATAAVGAAAGGLVAYLKQEGLSESSADRYVEVIRDGGAIVELVLSRNEYDINVAREVFEQNRGSDIEFH